VRLWRTFQDVFRTARRCDEAIQQQLNSCRTSPMAAWNRGDRSQPPNNAAVDQELHPQSRSELRTDSRCGILSRWLFVPIIKRRHTMITTIELRSAACIFSSRRFGSVFYLVALNPHRKVKHCSERFWVCCRNPEATLAST
jgi:hypothetical protein